MALITGKDIEDKEFKRTSFGGYAIQDVEDFMNRLADDVDAYAAEVASKTSKIAELESHIAELEAKPDEKEIANVFLDARRAAQTLVAEAHADSDKLLEQANLEVGKAEAKAKEILAQAQVEADKSLEQTKSDIAKSRSDCDDLIKLIDKAKGELRNLDLTKQQFIKDGMALVNAFRDALGAANAGGVGDISQAGKDLERKFSMLNEVNK